MGGRERNLIALGWPIRSGQAEHLLYDALMHEFDAVAELGPQ